LILLGPIEFVEADLSSLPSGSVVDMERRDTSVVERPRKEIAGKVLYTMQSLFS